MVSKTATPKSPEKLFDQGLKHQLAGRYGRAEQIYAKILQFWPSDYSALCNIGIVLQAQQKLEEALEIFQQVAKMYPEESRVHNNLGIALQAMGEVEPAVSAFDQAVKLDPNDADARYNRSIANLLNGQYEQGWADHEWRRYKKNNNRLSDRDYVRPLWKGESLFGKVIFLYAEQGLGDVIQFARFLGTVAEKSAHVFLECPPRLRRFLSTLEVADKITFSDGPPEDFDFHAAIMSLPYCLGITLQNLTEDTHSRVPYLDAEPKLID